MSAYPRARPDPPDRRFTRRKTTEMRAEIVFDDARIACIVRDVSTGGARLILAEAVDLPPEFKLLQGKGRRMRFARLVWIDGREIGAAWH